MSSRGNRRIRRQHRTNSVLIASEHLERRELLAVTMQQIANVNRENPWGNVHEFTAVGNDLYFVTSETNAATLDLWKSNGTTSGTIRIARLGPDDSQSHQLTNVNGTLFFRGHDAANGHELWMSNGTVAGTAIVRNLRYGAQNSTLTDLINHNGKLLFNANAELHKSDGTTAGTFRFFDAVPSSSDAVSELEQVGDHVFFRAKSSSGGFDLYRTNGFKPGTVKVTDLPAGQITQTTRIGSELFFVRNEGQLWKTTSNGASASLVADLSGRALPQELTEVDETLFFVSSGELWRSDGTAAGTTTIRAFSDAAENLFNMNGTLYFAAGASYQDSGVELWKSNGTTVGTVQVKNINPHFNEGYGYGSYPSNFVNVSGKLFFVAMGGLWKTDGTQNGTVQVEDGSASRLVNTNGSLTFFRSQSTGGLQLQTLAASSQTSVEVKRNGPGTAGSNPGAAVLHNGALYFSADDGVTGNELRRRNPNGTIDLVADLIPGSAGITVSNLSSLNGSLYFSVSHPTLGDGLWISDGTSEGTKMLSNVRVTASPSTSPFVSSGDLIFFQGVSSDGTELWKSDGTVSGTAMVKDIFPGRFRGYYRDYPNSSSPGEMVNVNGTLFFSAIDGVYGRELWKSDGTTGGTVLVKDLFPGATEYYSDQIFSSSPRGLSNRNGTLHFMALDESGIRFATSDGTQDGTSFSSDPIRGIRDFSQVTSVGSSLFFLASDFVHGQELWISDGTASGTRMIKDIRLGIDSSGIRYMTNVDGVLYFAADDGTHGEELWRSDGTTAGTRLVRDIATGFGAFNQPRGSRPSGFTSLNGVLFFTADAGINGRELWRTNGTASGATRLSSSSKGAAFSSPAGLVPWNGGILFSSTGALGRELWLAKTSAPAIANVAANAPYNEGSTPRAIAPDAVLTDADSAVLSGGQLIVSIANPIAGDLLSIRGSSGIEQIGNMVQFNGINIGRVSNSGTTNTNLVIDLNLNARLDFVQQLLRTVAFSSTSDNPTARVRNIRIRLTDGESGAVSRAIQVQVIPSNDRSTLSGLPVGVSYHRNSAPGVRIAQNAAVSDADSFNFADGQLRISVSGGDVAANRLELSGSLFSIDTSGNLLRASVIIGTVNTDAGVGAQPFVVTFNSASRAWQIRQLLSSVRFRTDGSSSNAQRRISISLLDGDGGDSGPLNVVVSVID